MLSLGWALGLFVAMAIPFALLAVTYWRHALFGVFILLIFEGALRKWVLPGAQAQIYLLKDAILLAAYVGFMLDARKLRGKSKGAGAISAVLALGFIFGCLEILNPNSPSLMVGIIGVKTYFLYAPLAFIMPYAFESREQFFRLLRWYLIICIPVAILGFVQIAAGPSSFLNTYVSYNEDTAVGTGFGREYSLIRTSGTFSYISGYAAFLSAIGFLALGFNIAQGWRIRNNIIPLATLTLIIGAMFTTGSRTPVYTLVATAPVILLWAAMSGAMALQTAMRLCLLIPVILVVALNLSPAAFEAFSDRASESGDSTSDRLVSGFDQIVQAAEGSPMLGFGIGTTHPSALQITGDAWPWWLGDMVLEGEMARVTVELGLLGLLLTFGLRILIFIFAVRCTLSFTDRTYRAFGICLTIHLGVGIMSSIMLNATAALYYWGALGLMLAMQRLKHTESLAARKKNAREAVQQMQTRPIET